MEGLLGEGDEGIGEGKGGKEGKENGEARKGKRGKVVGVAGGRLWFEGKNGVWCHFSLPFVGEVGKEDAEEEEVGEGGCRGEEGEKAFLENLMVFDEVNFPKVDSPLESNSDSPSPLLPSLQKTFLNSLLNSLQDLLSFCVLPSEFFPILISFVLIFSSVFMCTKNLIEFFYFIIFYIIILLIFFSGMNKLLTFNVKFNLVKSLLSPSHKEPLALPVSRPSRFFIFLSFLFLFFGIDSF